MAYLPKAYQHDTTLPEATGSDVHLQSNLIVEQYRLMNPVIEYYSLRNLTGIAEPDTVTGAPAPTGVPTGTVFDPVYGEIVPAKMLTDGKWSQPHLNADPELTASTQSTERYDGPFKIHARVQREAKEYELKLYGFDEMRDLLIHVPSATFDEYGITAAPGDKFVWDGDVYVVLQDKGTGYWKNTNLRLYRSLMAESKKEGA